MKKTILLILEYWKLYDFRYSALGFGEFCEIPQGVTVKQQASGLLRNARGVKPLWKISALALILFLLPFSIYSQSASKRLFIKTFDIKQGISPKLSEKFRDKLVLYFFEEGGGKYRVLSESDIKIMYQQAESLLKSGCDVEECLMQIAYAIDADIIIYGKMEKSEGQINVFAQSLIRNRETDELSKTSIVSVSFYESQIDWFAKEIVKKLINPKYYIDKRKAPLEIKIEVAPELLKTTKLRTEKLKVLKFKTDDTALQTITSILRNIIVQGDDHYKKKEYENARQKYKEVIQKMEKKISADKQKKLTKFKSGVYERITAAYKVELQNILKSGDDYFKNKDYDSAFNTYENIDQQIDDIEFKEVRKKFNNFKNITKERRDLVRVTFAKEKVLKGDTHYSDYKFEEAIEYYNKALGYLDELEIKTKKDNIAFTKDIKKKRDMVKKTGISYFKNQVQSYCDKIDVFNLKDEIEKAKEMLVGLNDLMQTSQFADFESRNKLKEMASLLNVSEYELGRKKREKEEARRKKKEDEKRRELVNNWFDQNFMLEIELGAGHIFNAFFSYKFGFLGVGVGGSYTFGTAEVMGKKFSEHYYNFTGHIDLHFIENNFWWLNLRQRIGYEFISIDEWAENGMFLSTGLLVGYHNYFAELAMPLFFGNEGTAIGVQMGVGLRFKF